MKLVLGARILLHVKSALLHRSGTIMYQCSEDGLRYGYKDLRALEATMDRIRHKFPKAHQEGTLPCASN